MCLDAVYLFWLGDPRVRQISVQEGMHGRDKFILAFYEFFSHPQRLETQTRGYRPPPSRNCGIGYPRN